MPSSAHPKAIKLLLPLAALLAISPLILHGGSCGQDQVFHIQSWLDAAQQLRHGHYPLWANTAAWNAGEPRFIFYPPLSWLLGALLTLLFPAQAAPVVYVFLALTAAGLTFYQLASEFVSPNAALLASAFYLANPYMLLNALERSAYAELLAAAWIPLLLLGILRAKPTVRGIAIPLALLWLTNAPAAVMGSYTLALLATLRVAAAFLAPAKIRYPEPSGSGLISLQRKLGFCLRGTISLRLARTYISGTALGLALPACYLLPAAVERKYVQVAMAIIPNMRFQDNFLFTSTSDAAHNLVNHTISTLALTILTLTVITISAASLLTKNTVISTLIEVEGPLLPPQKSVISTEGAFLRRSGETPVFPNLTTTLALLTAIIAFLLVPLSTPIWQHLPELAFLQFPWRLLTILSAVLSLALALLFHTATIRYTKAGSLRRQPEVSSGLISPQEKRGFRPTGVLFTLALPLALGLLDFHLYAQACDPHDTPANIAQLLQTGHGLGPTDEYTPNAADNDLLRTDNPGYWLAHNPNDPAPNTTPTATELHPDITNDDTPVPVKQTLSQQAPHHFTVRTMGPRYLILNLRDYPNWDITEADPWTNELNHPAHIPRDDGLIAISLNHTDDYTIDITWHRTWDQTLGLIFTALALLALLCETLLTPRTSRQSL